MNSALRCGVPVVLATVLFFLSASAAFADFEVTVTIFPINASSASAAPATGDCNLEGEVVTVVFDDDNGHTASPAVVPTCSLGTWSADTDVSGLDDVLLHVDVSQTDGVDTYSTLDYPVTKDTVPPTISLVYIDDGSSSTDANGYIFPTATAPSFYFESPDGDFASAMCQIDVGAIEDCTSWTYTSPSILADGSHTLHIIPTDAVLNEGISHDVDFCVDACGGGDTTPPVITAPATTTIEAVGASGATHVFSVTATDAVDGAITPACLPVSGSIFALGTTTVTCTAHDAAFNWATSTFGVIVTDTTAPVVTLTGDSAVTLTVGGSFTDEGATANDAVDGSFAATVGGSVNTSSAGTYTLTYNATDDAGNAATEVTRTVTVNPAPAPAPSGGGGGGGSGGSLYATAPTFGAVALPAPPVSPVTAAVSPQGSVLGAQTTNVSVPTEISAPPSVEAPAPVTSSEHTGTAIIAQTDSPQTNISELLDEGATTEIQEGSITQMATAGAATSGIWDWWWVLILILLAGIGGYWAWRKYRAYRARHEA